MLIRKATAVEVGELGELMRDAYARYVPRIGREPAPMTADYAALIEEGLVWVATIDRRVVGGLVLRTEAGSLLLENVAVAPAHQGRGIGRALIEFAERRARQVGAAEVVLYTNERMTENLALYPLLGYEEVDRRVEDGFRRVFFRKTVSL